MRNSIFFLVISMAISGPACCQEMITNPQQSDGFGSQFQTIIAAVVYAELHHKKYVYTPFEVMEHNYNNDPDFIVKKEELINFIPNFDVIDQSESKDYSINSKINYKAFFDANVAQCAKSLSLQKIKKIFRANKNMSTYFNNDYVHIAIHVRRPNAHDNRVLGADTPNTIFGDIINRLRVVYAGKNPLFHLYSQGRSEDFTLFHASDILLHLNESVEETFQAMVFADVLVISASSFSYTAALLSEGVVYYIPFWHSPLPHWISVDAILKK